MADENDIAKKTEAEIEAEAEDFRWRLSQYMRSIGEPYGF
jgi:hypothetical protein